MALTWYEKDAVGSPAIAKAGGTGPSSGTYYYIIVPYVINDAGISPDFVFFWYRPQYYGKQCAEQTITVNGSEEVQLSWTKVSGCDGYIVMRTQTSGNYNYSVRDRIWDAGDVASYTDNDQSGSTYKVNIPSFRHGCMVATSAYALWQILDDLFNVEGEDSAVMGLGSAQFDAIDPTVAAGGSFWGLAIAQGFEIHLHDGAAIYGSFYDNANEQQLWLKVGNIYLNEGSRFSLGSSYKNSNYHGNTVFIFYEQTFQSNIYGVPGATFAAFGISMGAVSLGGSNNYIDDYLNADWEAGALIMSGARTIGISDGDCDVAVDGLDYFESYYQFGIRAPTGTGSINVERYRAHEAGNYIFLRGAYSYTLKDFDYSDWRTHSTDTDVWFYDPSSDPFTGTVVLINPSWKDKTSAVPVVAITDYGNQHTGTCTIKFEVDVKVVDTDGTALSGATVAVYDTDGNQLVTDTTDGDGLITTQEVTHAIYSCDADNNPVTTNKYPHQLVVSKAGYNSLTYDLVIDRPLDMTVPLSLQSFAAGELDVTLEDDDELSVSIIDDDELTVVVEDA